MKDEEMAEEHKEVDWERSEDDEQAIGVIAWCEKPQFKE